MPARSPEEVDVLFARALNDANLDALVSLYEPNGTLIGAPGQPATGHAAIREALSGFVAMKPTIDLKVEQTVRAGDDIAACYGVWTLNSTGEDGKPQTMTGKSIEIVRRQPDGTWLFAIDDPWARGS